MLKWSTPLTCLICWRTYKSMSTTTSQSEHILVLELDRIVSQLTIKPWKIVSYYLQYITYTCDNYISSLSTAPASPPVNVATDSPSSTSINVTWEEVPSINQNGIIITYEVCYEPLETFGDAIMKEMVNTSELFHELTDLEQFVDYNISVRAYTSQGPGPFSDDLTQMTLEDGMSTDFILMLQLLLYHVWLFEPIEIH